MRYARVLVQVDRPGKKLDMGDIEHLLEGTGFKLDTDFGPILINSKLGRYVVRGSASPEARARAEEIDGVRVFAEGKLQPM